MKLFLKLLVTITAPVWVIAALPIALVIALFVMIHESLWDEEHGFFRSRKT